MPITPEFFCKFYHPPLFPFAKTLIITTVHIPVPLFLKESLIKRVPQQKSISKGLSPVIIWQYEFNNQKINKNENDFNTAAFPIATIVSVNRKQQQKILDNQLPLTFNL